MSSELPMWSSGLSHDCWGPLPLTGPLPSFLLPLQTRSPTQLPVQALFSAQRSSHTEKISLNQLRAEVGGRKGEENALETLVEIEKVTES